MSTTTIRLPDELRARITEAVDFEAVVEQRYARIVETGKTIPWSEMRGYLEARIVGRPGRRPVARKLAPTWASSRSTDR